jgi:Beta-glucosidase-related glycosidases
MYIGLPDAVLWPVMKITKTNYTASCAILVACLALILTSNTRAQAPVPDSPAIETKAKAMLAKLSLEQKIELLGGVDNMYTRPMPVIDLPRFKMSDASVGVRTWGPTTAYAGGVALAATWDPAFAHRLGVSLGKDSRARGVNFLLGPGVNIARAPVGGRNFEYLSEDPFLNGALAVPFIEGVQSQGVIATVKHYALNNQEFNRHNSSSDVDERTMREIYLPAFEAAVMKGKVDSVMNSYNQVNGVHATQSDLLNNKILKGEWGFDGVLMSDWDATYDGAAAANGGLDLEMPSPKFMNAKNLVAAVKSGQVRESVIDDKIMRLLRTELRYGFTDRPQWDANYPTYALANRAVALQGALESITLLKNEGDLLPLDPTKIKTIAVIGPDAAAFVAGGGSSEPTPFDSVSTLTGIAELLGPEVRVLFNRGLPEANELFRNTRWEGVVKVQTFASRDFSGTVAEGTQRNLANWRPNEFSPADPTPRSIRYTASFKAEKAGKYLLLAGASGSDGFKVLVDGKQVVEQVRAEGAVPKSVTLDLSAGQIANVQVDYLPGAAGTRMGVGFAYEPDLITAEAKQYAKAADVVIVAVGFDKASEGEGHDRTFTLPLGQDALIEAMAVANPHTIVTLASGGAVDTRRWLDKVPAFLHVWYPGQEGGVAVAQVLFGKHNPEGKLPVTFDRDWDQSPARQYYYPVEGGDTTLHTTGPDGKLLDYTIEHINYGDKLMVGYRYWTTTGKHALYPFGYGLSYTTFSFANLKAPATAASGSTVEVSFDVTNTGKVAGAEVAQLYVSDPSAKVQRPERELKGFEKIRLAPGETKHVTLSLDARAFSYWSDTTHKWIIDPGKFAIFVGDSSENTPLHTDIALN